MAKKLYVGNLGANVDKDTLVEWFSAHGTVESAHIIIDRETGQSRGYGFVEMSTDEEASAAEQALNGKEIDGKALKVAEAVSKPKPQGRGGGRGGFGGRGPRRGGPGGGRPGGGGGRPGGRSRFGDSGGGGGRPRY